MAIPNPKFSYITSTHVQGLTTGEVFGWDLPKGHKSVVAPIVNASGSTLGHNVAIGVEAKVDFSQGQSRPRRAVQKTVKDVVQAVASGMTPQGVLTYGDGRQTTTTTWATDTDLVGKGDFELFRPRGAVVYSYSNLST